MQTFVHDYLPQNYRIAQNVTDSFNTTANTEVDLYIDSVPAGTFLHNGDNIRFHYAGGGNVVSNSGVFIDHTLKLYVAGVQTFNSNNYTFFAAQAGPNWIIRGNVVRDSTSSLKTVVNYTFYGLDFDIVTGNLRRSYSVAYFPVTGVNFNATMSIRLTGFAESASFVTASFSKTLFNV
jgi:hypothetical protein